MLTLSGERLLILGIENFLSSIQSPGAVRPIASKEQTLCIPPGPRARAEEQEWTAERGTSKTHPVHQGNQPLISKPCPQSIMGALGSRPDQLFSSFKTVPSRSSSYNQNRHPPKSIFASLRTPPTVKPNDFIPLFNDCISVASARTQEYLMFRDPENKFSPSPEVLTEIFLMTYISETVTLNLTDTFNCTVMTPRQRVLLGADWVWAILDKPTKNPRIQIAVQVLHLPEREGTNVHSLSSTEETYDESREWAQMAASDKNMCEKLVNFCASIGKDCYALFLFMGRKNDKDNIYGVLSNNFEVAIGKCDKIDRALIENFFKGSRYLHTPTGMMQAIVTKRNGDPLTLMIKFS